MTLIKYGFLFLLFTAAFAKTSVDVTESLQFLEETTTPEYSIEIPDIPTFCWKDSYGRGVGIIPQTCGSDREKIGLLCYSKCPSGMTRFGFDCHSVCPSGWRDDGLFCRLAEYGRGVGYPWQFGDPLNDSGMFRRCEADNGRGNCETWGLVVYPKCKPGYSPFGCCICRPAVPNCGQFNLGMQVDLSCAKKIIIGNPIPGTCAAGEVYDAGLCYQPCRNLYRGVGPVCWGLPPAGWVDCGMGAAISTQACTAVVIDQISKIADVAFNIASLCGSGTIKTADKIQNAITKFDQIKALF